MPSASRSTRIFTRRFPNRNPPTNPEGTVLQQLRKGYKFKERLLRPATVIVAKKPAGAATPKNA